jgi:tetratricopeptide (TPR) repeat protein
MPDSSDLNSPLDAAQPDTTTTNVSGGVDLDAQRDVVIGGDVVGRDKIVTTNVRNIRNLRIDLRLLPVVIVLVIIIGVLIYQLIPKVPSRMSGDFNVAVAEFETVDANGQPVESPAGRALADSIYAHVKAGLSEANIEKVVGHYEPPWPPAQTGRIAGRTAEERAASAAQLAEHINADMLIYGVVTEAGDRSRLTPEFYVRKKGFEQGQELVGPHALGSPLRVVLPFKPTGFTAVDNPALAGRIDALSLITIGLVYLSADKPQEALEYFQQAEQIQSWLKSAGKELVYLVMGNAALRLSSTQKSTAPLTTAEEFFAAALEINPDYARAQLGQAGVAYLQAFKDPLNITSSTVDLARLDEAERAYRAAGSMKDAPSSAHVPTKIAFGLGQIFLVRGAILSDSAQLAQARSELESVISAYRDGTSSDQDLIRDFAGQAYARLGVLAKLRQDWPAAIGNYQQAIPLVTPFYQAAYNAALGDVYLQAGQRDEAIAAYTEAVSIAENVDPASAERYAKVLKQIQNEH